MKYKNSGIDIRELANHFLYNEYTGEILWKNQIGSAKKNQVAGTKHSGGYVQLTIKGRRFLAHRVAWALHYGAWPSSNIDHINHIRSDNSIKNLRIASTLDNSKNARRSSRNTTGHTGVSVNRKTGKYHAYISLKGKRKHIGYFTFLDDAVKARAKFNELYGYHENHGSNSPKYRTDKEIKEDALAVRSAGGRKLKRFAVMSPDNRLIIGINLKEFCLKNNLQQGSMWTVINGAKESCKGWKKVSPKLLSFIDLSAPNIIT